MLEQYKDLPFVDRVLNPQKYPKPTKFDEQGRPQTHLLAADQDEESGDWIVWPKLTVKDGKYVEQSFADAKASGDVINFGQEKDAAIGFSKNYKPKEFEDFYRQKKANGDEARSDIDKAIEELTLFGPISEDPLYAISMMVFGPTGKLKLADLASDLAKHSRVKSLRKSGTEGDLADAKTIYKTIKVKDEGKARQLYTDMLNEGKKIASPQDIEKATRNFRRKTEIKKSIESIPLKERLALYTDDTIPLTGKYKALDEDVIDFYDDIIDIQKIPKNYKSGDNSLAKVFLDKKNIPSRVDLDPKLNQLRPRPYYEEIFDFSKNKEKIKLYIPKKDVGGGVKYRTKTINDPSKNEIQKLLDEI